MLIQIFVDNDKRFYQSNITEQKENLWKKYFKLGKRTFKKTNYEFSGSESLYLFYKEISLAKQAQFTLFTILLILPILLILLILLISLISFITFILFDLLLLSDCHNGWRFLYYQSI